MGVVMAGTQKHLVAYRTSYRWLDPLISRYEDLQAAVILHHDEVYANQYDHYGLLDHHVENLEGPYPTYVSWGIVA
jgi:hypothetical protein